MLEFWKSAGIAFPALAQQFATLNLTVHDPSGSNVPQAKVTVRNVETGVIREDVSDKTGMAVIHGLTAGRYALTLDLSARTGHR